MFFYPVTYTVIAAQCKNPKSTFIQCLNEDEKKTADAFSSSSSIPFRLTMCVCVCARACVRMCVCTCGRISHRTSPLPPCHVTQLREEERDRDSNQT